MEKDIKLSGNMGFIGWLTLLFIAFKLSGIITWPWVWVLAPLWIACIIAFIVAFILAFVKEVKKR